MADYPDWVLAHKKKGTYINKVGDKFYLYAAHSERVPGTKKVKRVCDGYLGRITETQGLIPPKQKLNIPFRSFEYGLSSLALSLCGNIHKGLRRTFVIHGDFIMCASILNYIYGCFSEDLFHHSWLSLRFPQLVFPSQLTGQQENGIQRGTRMVTDVFSKTFGEDLAQVKAAFSLVILASSGRDFYCSELPDSVPGFIEHFSLTWRADLWQKSTM